MKHICTLIGAGFLTLPFLGLNSSLAQGLPPAVPTNAPWVGSIAAGFTLTRGNSETLLFTANAAAQRKGPKHEILLGADSTYGEATDQETDDTDRTAAMAHAFGQYNYLFTERFYGYARLDALHDAVANIHYRFTVSPGVGYYFIKDPKTTLAGEFGPGFVHERVHNDERDRDDTEDYITLRFAERLEHKFSPTVRLWQSVEFLPQIDRMHNYIINAELGVETTLTKRLSLRTFAQNTYDNEPAKGRKHNDLKIVTALAYKF